MYDNDNFDDEIDDINVVLAANDLCAWCEDNDWSDQLILDVCKLIVEANDGIEAADRYKKMGGFLN